MTQAYTKYRQQEKHDINLQFIQFCFINIDYRTIIFLLISAYAFKVKINGVPNMSTIFQLKVSFYISFIFNFPILPFLVEQTAIK